MTETPIPTVVVETPEVTETPKKSRVRLYVAIAAAGVTAGAAVIIYLATRDKTVDDVITEAPSDELWTPTEV